MSGAVFTLGNSVSGSLGLGDALSKFGRVAATGLTIEQDPDTVNSYLTTRYAGLSAVTSGGVTTFLNPSLVVIPSAYNNGIVYSLHSKQVNTGDFTVTRNTEARRVNSVGQIASIGSGLPRLDYLTSGGTVGTPALLVEPSGTNLFARSNELNIGSPWTQDNISFTTGSTSAFTSPDGTTNAFLLADTSGNTRHRISQQPTTSFVSGTTYTVSIFVKKNSSNRFLLINAATAFGARAALNLDTLAITNIDGSGASIDNYGNGWYRFLVRGTATSTQATSVFIQMQNAATDVPYIGDGSSFYLFAAQLETGSVATSYIPTTTGTGSRSADVVSVSGAVSGSIGQTEGTIYAEVDVRVLGDGRFATLSDGTSNNRIQCRFNAAINGLDFLVRVSGSSADFSISNSSHPSFPATIPAGTYKIALGYKQNDYVVAMNGVTYTPTSATRNVPSNFSKVTLGADVSDLNQFNNRIRAVALYTTRLTNAELATLTTP